MDPDAEMKDEDTFSNSAEDSSSDEDADDEKISEIKDQLGNHPYSYDLHVQLITLCRKLGDLDQLRSAREKMSKLFPLTPELWLDWLTDEKTLATTQEQKESLTELFERAIKDYASVSVWLEYVQFSIGKIGETWEDCGLETIRETFERGITAVGVHVTQGCLIWEAYREFEAIYFHHLKKKNASEEELKQQEDRVYTIFKRQLSIPLFDMDKTYDEFKEQYNETSCPDMKSLEYSYKKALSKLDQVQVYENALYESESPHYEEYNTYIQYEIKNGEPSRVQNLYERALIENCLKEELWLDYTKYMDRVIKIRDMSLPVHERAVRNLPWCVQLWARYARAMETYQEPHTKVVEILQTALMSGFTEAEDFKELWLAYLDYLRRRIKKEDLEAGITEFDEIEKVFDKATTQMTQYYWGTESEYVIMKYWLFFVAKYKKDIENARVCWKEVIEHGHREEARFWLDYANFEKLYGDATHYRRCLLQALSCVSDWPETFLDLIITFEREEGTLESLEKSLLKCETMMQHINEKRLKKLEEASSSVERKDRRRHSFKQQSKFSKSESPKTESDSAVQMDSEGFKIPPLPGKLHPSEINSKSDSQSDVELKRKKISEDDLPEPKKRKVQTLDSHGTSVAHDSSKDERTVFVSNLSYEVEEDKIKEYFSQMGEVEEVRLVKDFKGRSKGYCYVLYKTQAEAKNALSKDRERLDGRPVLISPCEDRKNNPSFHPKFRFGTGLERNKLFIKNLPFSTTKEDLKTMFTEYGCVKDVRIVTYRNGHSKGIAYVEFDNETSAANAVEKTDGSQVMDKMISVAISNPPPKKPKFHLEYKQKREFSSVSKSESHGGGGGSARGPKQKREFSSISITESLGGGGGLAKGPRGRGRTQLSLVPRSVARQPPNKKNSIHSNNSLQNGQNSNSTSSSEEKKPLSNSDFANMLKK